MTKAEAAKIIDELAVEAEQGTYHCDAAMHHAPARLVEFIGRVMAALEKEWRANHDEHCSNVNDHLDADEACYWPRPDVLKEWKG